MFTNKTASYYSQNKVLIEAACLSTDTKPTTGVANGSKCIEMDTGKRYMFNEEDSEWEELPSSGGGGGTTVEALSVTQNGTYTAPSGKAYSPVTVNVSGGSSDFSTAEVTITNSTSSNIMQSCIIIFEFMGEQAMIADPPSIGVNQSVTYDVVLFKGTQIIYAPDDVHIAVAGDITEEEGAIVIAGDGTITYTTK